MQYMLTVENADHTKKVLRKKKAHAQISSLRDNHCHTHHI